MPFLELKKVSKGFRHRGPVLKDINSDHRERRVRRHRRITPAPARRRSRLIAGLLKPDSGTVKLNDLEITEPGPDRGIVFQNYSLLPWLSVFENIRLAVDQVNPNWTAAKKTEHVEKYIAW
jgi:nitrate/nitrite transport system ATP-binding protein